MIYDARIWKRLLARNADELRKVAKRYRDSAESVDDDAFGFLELQFFTSAFVIRKLLDSQRISDELEADRFPVRTYPRRRRRTRLPSDAHEIHDRYVFTKSTVEWLTLRKLCGFLIHSHDFIVMHGRRLTLLFNSDRTEQLSVYEISVSAFVGIVKTVVEDDIGQIQVIYSPADGRILGLKKPRATDPRTVDPGGLVVPLVLDALKGVVFSYPRRGRLILEDPTKEVVDEAPLDDDQRQALFEKHGGLKIEIRRDSGVVSAGSPAEPR